MERGGLNTGDNVVLLYPPGKRTHTHAPLIILNIFLYFSVSYTVKYYHFLICLYLSSQGYCVSVISAGIDLIAAFYGCLYAGVIPVTVRPPHPQNLAATLPTVRMIIDVSAYHWDCVMKIKTNFLINGASVT